MNLQRNSTGSSKGPPFYTHLKYFSSLAPEEQPLTINNLKKKAHGSPEKLFCTVHVFGRRQKHSGQQAEQTPG